MPHRAVQPEPARPRPHATIVTVLALLASACSGQPAPAAQAPTSEPITTATAPTVAAPAEPTRIPLMLFPYDSNFLLFVDVARVTATPLYQALLARWVDQRLGDQLDQIEQICSLNLKSTLGRVLSAHTFDDEFEHKDDQHMFSIDGLRRDQVRRCTLALAERKLARGVVEDGPYNKVDTANGPMWYVWLDEDTAVVPTDMTIEQLRARHDSTENLHNNVAMAELAHVVDRNAAAWFIMRVPAGRIGKNGVQFDSIYGWVHLGQGLDARVGFRHPDRESARRTTVDLAKNLDQLIAQSGDLAKYLEGLEVGSQDTDMLVTLTMDKQQLAEFLDNYGDLIANVLVP